jgi:hypothetical protein
MTCSAAVGFATLLRPLRGAWPFADFPEHVQINGRSFTRSDTWAVPMAGVVRQYREDADRESMHLYVRDDRTWEIDHVDAANPERGLVLEHTFRDVIYTSWGAGLLVLGVVAASAGLSYALTRR